MANPHRFCSVYAQLDPEYSKALPSARQTKVQTTSLETIHTELGFPHSKKHTHLHKACVVGLPKRQKNHILKTQFLYASASSYGNFNQFCTPLFLEHIIVEVSTNPAAVPTSHSVFLYLDHLNVDLYIQSPEFLFIKGCLSALPINHIKLFVSASDPKAVNALASALSPFEVKPFEDLESAITLLCTTEPTQRLTPLDHLFGHNPLYPDLFLPIPGLNSLKYLIGASGSKYNSLLKPHTKSGKRCQLFASSTYISKSFTDHIVKSFGTFYNSIPLNHPDKRSLIPLLRILLNDFHNTFEPIQSNQSISKSLFTQPKLAFGKFQHTLLNTYPIENKTDVIEMISNTQPLRGLLAFCNAASILHGYEPVYNIGDLPCEVSLNECADGYRLPTFAELDILRQGFDSEAELHSIPRGSIGLQDSDFYGYYVNSFGMQFPSNHVEIAIDGADMVHKKSRSIKDSSAIEGSFLPSMEHPPLIVSQEDNIDENTINTLLRTKPICFRLVRYNFL